MKQQVYLTFFSKKSAKKHLIVKRGYVIAGVVGQTAFK